MMSTRTKILLFSIVLGIIAWVGDAYVHGGLFFGGTGTESDVTPHHVFMRSLLTVMFVVFGWIAGSLAQKLESNRRKSASDRDLAEITLRSVSDAVITCDTLGRIVTLNHRAQALIGWSEDEARGRDHEEFFSFDWERTSEPVPCLVKDALKHNRRIEYHDDVFLKNRRGSDRLVRVSAEPIRVDESHFLGVVIVFHDVTEQRRIQNELLENAAKYRNLVEGSPVGIISIASDGTIVEVNDKLLEILGSPSREETRAINVLTFPPLVAAGVSEKVAVCCNEGRRIAFEVPYRSLWGKDMYLRVLLTPRRPEIEAPCSCQAVVEDVTDRKIAEERLKWELSVNAGLAELYEPVVSESVSIADVAHIVLEKARHLTDSEHGYVSEVDPVTRANVGHTLTAMLGTECDIVGGKQLAFPPEADGTYPALFGHSLNTREAFFTNGPAEHPASRGLPEGHIPLERFLSVPVRIGDELVGQIALANSTRDYTDRDLEAVSRLAEYYALAIQRKRTGEALRSSEEMMRLVIEYAPIGIAMTQNGRLIYVNPAYVRLFGYEHSHDLLGERPERLYLESDRELVRSQNPEDPKTEQVVPFVQARAARQSGESFLVSRWAAKTEFKGIPTVIAFLVDVSEAESLRAQLVQAQKMEAIGTLAGGIAHDFNNLLMVIRGHVDALLLDEQAASTGKEELTSIRKAASDASELVKRLMAVSRKAESRPRPTDLNEELRQLHPFLQRVLPKSIDIHMRLSDDIEPINADPGQLEQVILNLTVNARDAMPEGGSLVFETCNITLDEEYAKVHLEPGPGKYVKLTVKDTGQGIEEGALQRIFEPFYTTKAPGEGTGLGLAMVFGIVKGHGGHILCKSSLGQGTSFDILLPSINGNGNGDRTVAEENSIPRLDDVTVLLVDDDSAVRDPVTKLLTKFGVTVIPSGGPEEALELYSKHAHRIDLVVLDLIMPGMGGRGCLERLLHINPEVKVLIASGHLEALSRPKHMPDGAVGFLPKPYDVYQMLREIETLTQSR